MDRQNFFQDFQQRLLEMFRASPAADLERNLKALMAQSFNRLELVTRDEFDAQREMLRDLSDRVAALEASAGVDVDAPAAAGSSFESDAASPAERSPYDAPPTGGPGFGAPPAIDPRGNS